MYKNEQLEINMQTIFWSLFYMCHGFFYMNRIPPKKRLLIERSQVIEHHRAYNDPKSKSHLYINLDIMKKNV
jgi:hypothetical protein